MSLATEGDAFISLSHEAKELYLPKHVPRMSAPPSPLTFLRKYVMPNVPVVIENGISHWPALAKWTKQYLCGVIGDKTVTVATTPNGYADATVGDRFVLPQEERILFSEFLRKLELSKSGDEIVYVQNQNSSFLEEFHELLPDAAEDIPWASEAFGRQPDAVNFWMGGSRSVTSMHKDHYENLYGVVAGSKTFTLHPPTDLPCIPYEEYKVGRYRKNSGTGVFDIVDEVNLDHCPECESRRNNASEGSNSELDLSDLIHALKSENCEMIRNSEPSDPLGIKDMHDVKLSNGSTGKTNSSELMEANSDQIDLCLCNCHEPGTVPWIAIDPLNPDYKKYPVYRHAHQVVVTLLPGDLLYLPSLWFHHVQQSDDTIAVNFWYDMEYDIKYAYFKFVESLIPQKRDGSSPT